MSTINFEPSARRMFVDALDRLRGLESQRLIREVTRVYHSKKKGEPVSVRDLTKIIREGNFKEAPIVIEK